MIAPGQRFVLYLPLRLAERIAVTAASRGVQPSLFLEALCRLYLEREDACGTSGDR